jgi:putative membrane protein
LPYQIVRDLGWWTVPAVVVASFALLGILGIGWEIENPFGYDDNDLVIKIRYVT